MLHQNITPSFRHAIHSWEVADNTALLALSVSATDVGKVALQLSPFNLFILQDDDDGMGAPIWTSLFSAITVEAGVVTVVDSEGYFTAATVEEILEEIGATLEAYATRLSALEDNVIWAVACSDEINDITAAVDKIIFHAPFNADILEVFAGLSTPQTSGSVLTVDVLKNDATLFSTLITIDNTEETSLTATTPAALSVTTCTKGDKLSVDVTQAGTGAKGLKVYMRVRRTA